MSRDRAQIIRTDAVVLRAMDFGETSRIVTLFTREQGRIGLMARGARGPKSRFGATLEPMACVQAVYYHKPGRELQSLSECSHVHLFPRIASSLDRLEVGLRSVELTASLLQAGQAHPAVLDLLVDTLVRLEHADERAANLWPYFAMRLAGVLGLSPSFARSDVEAVGEKGGWLDLENGGILGAPAGTASLTASRAGLRAFAVVTRADAATVIRMQMEPAVHREVEHLVESFIRYHVEDSYPSRSSRVFGQLHG